MLMLHEHLFLNYKNCVYTHFFLRKKILCSHYVSIFIKLPFHFFVSLNEDLMKKTQLVTWIFIE